MKAKATLMSEEVLAQLERITSSAPFANCQRSQRFLRYVVEASLNNADESLKEFTIAVEVFERDASYDPAVDATVRVEAGRLRARLREYYAEFGHNDPILIEIPKGGYRANLIENPQSPRPAPLPQKVPRPTWQRAILLFATAALLIAAIGGTALLIRSRDRVPPVNQHEIVLAVLPFTNQSDDPAKSYLTEGITQTLIRQFSELPQFRVISRVAVDRINRQNAVSQYAVGYLLTGSLMRKAEAGLVLNVELSNAKSGAVLSSNQYIPNEADLRPIQADIVQNVIDGLGVQLNGKESAGVLQPLTKSPAAFDSFLRGETMVRRSDDPEGLHRAIPQFQEAIRLDPTFALAYSSLAEAHLKLGTFFESPLENMPSARENALRALSLDPSISQAHGILGLIELLYDWNQPAAQKELAEADTRQSAIWSLGCTTHLLTANGRYRHAEEDLQQMLEFNPESTMLISELGCVKYYSGQYDEAIRYYRQALSMDSQSVLAHWGLSRALTKKGRYKEALETLYSLKTPTGIKPPIVTAEIGYIEGISGDRRGAEQRLQELKDQSKKMYVDPYLIAVIYLSLKDNENTYSWLDKAYQVRSPFLISLASDPKWSGELHRPQLQALWNRMTQKTLAAKNYSPLPRKNDQYRFCCHTQAVRIMSSSCV